MILSFFSTIAFAKPDLHTTSLGYPMIQVPAGRFMMGSSQEEDEDEHEVVLTHSFYAGIYEVNQRIWEQFQTHQSRFRAPDLPVSGISFFDALLFANFMSSEEGLEECYIITPQAAEWRHGFACTGYRIPTEAEWEYMARAGEGNLQEQDINSYAWSKGNSENKPHPVGSKKANAFGLYDTLGNVWEWVWDIYEEYPKTEVIDPIGANKGVFRIRRGGGYSTGSTRVRLADRYALNPINQHSFLGVRLVKTIKK